MRRRLRLLKSCWFVVGGLTEAVECRVLMTTMMVIVAAVVLLWPYTSTGSVDVWLGV